jgi:hypothetical protein
VDSGETTDRIISNYAAILAFLDESLDESGKSYKLTTNLGVALRYMHLHFGNWAKTRKAEWPPEILDRRYDVLRAVSHLEAAYLTGLPTEVPRVPETAFDGYDTKKFSDADIKILHDLMKKLDQMMRAIKGRTS